MVRPSRRKEIVILTTAYLREIWLGESLGLSLRVQQTIRGHGYRPAVHVPAIDLTVYITNARYSYYAEITIAKRY